MGPTSSQKVTKRIPSGMVRWHEGLQACCSLRIRSFLLYMGRIYTVYLMPVMAPSIPHFVYFFDIFVVAYLYILIGGSIARRGVKNVGYWIPIKFNEF